MSKIIVIERCAQCADSFYIWGGTRWCKRDKPEQRFCPIEGIPDWCPLHSFPRKRNLGTLTAPESFAPGELDLYITGLLMGWNAALDEILKGLKENEERE